MFTKTRGIVLHTIKYSETSVIAKIYTEHFGLLSFMVKGVRSAKSKAKASLMQPLTILEMELQYRESRNLQFIKEYRRDIVYQSVPFDTLKSTIALFMLEVLTKAIREHEPNGELFDFIYESFVMLDKEEKVIADFHLLFIINLARYIGFQPHGNYSDIYCCFEMQEGVFTMVQDRPNVMNKHDSALLYSLISTPLYMAPPVKLSRTERREMLYQLIRYYALHIENFQLKSPEVLEEILG